MIIIKCRAISYTYSRFTKTVSLMFIFLRIKDKLQKIFLITNMFSMAIVKCTTLTHTYSRFTKQCGYEELKSKESYLGSKQSTFILYYFSMSRQAKKNVNFSIEQVGRVR